MLVVNLDIMPYCSNKYVLDALIEVAREYRQPVNITTGGIDASSLPPKSILVWMEAASRLLPLNLAEAKCITVAMVTSNNYGISWQKYLPRVFDYVVSEFNTDPPSILFNLTGPQMEEYVSHWLPIYRTVEKDKLGRFKATWVTQEGKADHWALATLYWKIAMEKSLGVKGGGISPASPTKKEVGPTIIVTPEGKFEIPAYDIKSAFKKPKGRYKDAVRSQQ